MHLTSLPLSGFSLSNPPQVDATKQLLSKLVDLKLEVCRFSSQADFLRLVSSAHLTALSLKLVHWPQQSCVLPAVLQPACRKLHKLELGFFKHAEGQWGALQFTDLASISSLTSLQELNAGLPSVEGAAVTLLDFQTSLTRLCLQAGAPKYVLTQQVLHLTGLRQLTLWGVEVQSDVLSKMTQLQWLALHNCYQLPDEAQQAVQAQQPDALLTAHRIEALLAAIGNLKQLRILRLQLNPRALAEGARISPSACAALTASSKLEMLWFGCPIALTDNDILQHLLPKGRQLEQLQYLGLRCEHESDSQAGMLAGWQVQPADLALGQASCPGLHWLQLNSALGLGDLGPLLQLTSCKDLEAGGPAFQCSASAVAVAQLTQLTSLTWHCATGHPGCITCADLGQLTTMTQLQFFKLQQGDICMLAEAARQRQALEQQMGEELPLELEASDEVSTVCPTECFHILCWQHTALPCAAPAVGNRTHQGLHRMLCNMCILHIT